MKRELTFTPAWDKRHTDPNKNYGIHGVEIRFVLSGPLGAVQFVCASGWYLKQNRTNLPASLTQLTGYDVGYHSPKPMYEGQTPMGLDCPYIEGECFYDGSGLRAQEWVEELISGGSDRIWELLEQEYKGRFLDDRQNHSRGLGKS